MALTVRLHIALMPSNDSRGGCQTVMGGIVLQDVSVAMASKPVSVLSLSHSKAREIAHCHAHHVEHQGYGEAHGRGPPETGRVPVPHGKTKGERFESRPELVVKLWRVPMSDEGVDGAA